ncbi:MAG: UDP-N-acetylmuramoyl-L-alanyl-D-glutamate--2,6-diaminopimelate ligase [Actinomycetota bacterium]
MIDSPPPVFGGLEQRLRNATGTARETVHGSPARSTALSTMLPQPIKLEELAARAPGSSIISDGAVLVSELAYDSRSVAPGTLFFCRPGASRDGHDFAEAAIASGAVALVVERALDVEVPQLVVSSVHESMGPIAAKAFGDPSRHMRVVGVTGTNGKTTTSFMIESCLKALGFATGLIGTIETRIDALREPAGRTTPESVDLQRTLHRMRSSGVGAIAMEVSSHGLALHRVDGTSFACSVFTNLTQDHLDFHHTMEDYFKAKSLLFDRSFSSCAAINVSDPYGARLAESLELDALTTFGNDSADVFARDVVSGASGSTFECRVRGKPIEVRIRLAGAFNVANAIASIAAMAAMQLDVESAAEGLWRLEGVPGRFERVDAGQDFTVIVDYAHTPDSVERVLHAARDICEGSLCVVVGCGGDRDRVKRPLMGRAAAALSDRAILTSDNPRSEDPLMILEEVARGARETGRSFDIEPDRRSAIRLALSHARPGDVIVIAGKGHESGQEFADRTIPFDDRVVAREELEAL